MNIRWKLFAILSIALLVNLAVGIYAANRYLDATREANRILRQSSEVVTTALRAQVHFKKQVQEWKNTLLRGHEKSLYDKYQKQFIEEENLTRQLILDLLKLLTPDSPASEISSTFLSAHQRLGLAYRQALRQFDPSDLTSQIQVDRQVRGIDREPTNLIDQVVEATQVMEQNQLRDVHEGLAETERRIATIALVVLLSSLLTLLWLVDRGIARPISMATSIAQSISSGDLDSHIEETAGEDEAGRLLRALSSMQQSLRHSHQQLQQEQKLLAKRVQERTRELAIANEELARAAKAKDLFLATMSHELRTPLTTVLGLTEMLSDGLYGEIGEAQQKALATVDESARHLLTLINDILDLAKVESGKMELQWDLVPVEQLVEASLRLVRQPARKKHLQVEHRIAPDIELIRGDSRRLKQVLVNLLGNAVKFTPEYGSIGLEVEADQQNRTARFIVWDTGIGIDPEQQSQLFQPFVQLDNELTRRYSGTGLGLTLVRRMMELHGGSISVESKPGRGSRFTLVLDWNPQTDTRQSTRPAKPPGRSGQTGSSTDGRIRVLLAEDNTANRDMIRDYIEHNGIEVLTAASGPEALNLARDFRPDVVLMDVQLAGMDGLEVTRRLRRLPGLSQMPIIALTAMAMPGDREQCLEAGMDDYLSKPVGLGELLEKIRATASHTQS